MAVDSNGLTRFKNFFDENKVENVLAVFPDLYGRLLGKRLTVEHFLDILTEGKRFHACDYLLTADIDMEPVAGYEYSNWTKGYGDMEFSPDLETLRVASWFPSCAVVICDLYAAGTNELLPHAPRTILRKQAQRAADMGLAPMVGSELEYYIFKDAYEEAFHKDYENLSTCGRYRVDYNVGLSSEEESLHRTVAQNLKAARIVVEGCKGEWGVGQHEFNLRFSDILENADNHCLFKQCLKESANKMGLSVSFMAKYKADCAGSSCHLHLSLWRNDQNVCGRSSERKGLPDLFRWFLGGWILHVPELMVFYAPTINSYKRFRARSWAPNKLAWGGDNRTVAFRTVGSASTARIEFRIPGADCNPYLASAAALASGLDGIARQIEPPPAFSGNAYEAHDHPQIPLSLREAIKAFSDSNFPSSFLGREVAAHYLRFYSNEQEAFDQSVTDWELKRYFERI